MDDSADATTDPDASPLALQLAVRLERVDPPTVAAICAAAALATVELLDDERSRPGGEWHDAVAAWNGARIRKLVRRARGSAWARAQEAPGVTVARDGAEVRAFVPGPMSEAPPEVAALQIRSTPLDEPVRVDVVGQGDGLFVALTPEAEMSWGKQAAQCAHAVQWAWMRSEVGRVAAWDRGGRPITVVHPDRALWDQLAERSSVQIHDGGFTEVAPGTRTAVAWWGDEPMP